MKHLPSHLMMEQTPSVLLKVEVLEKRMKLLAQILVLALSGLLVEACIIYRLHTLHSSENVSAYKASNERMLAIFTRLKTIDTKMEELTKANKEVAFTAALQTASWERDGFRSMGPFGVDRILDYSNVLTNVGGAYDSGVFTAPVKGLYFFTFTSYSWVKDADIGVRMMKNNQEVLLAWEKQDSGDNEDYASNSVLLELEVMDKVYMYLPKGFYVAASMKSNINTFSGFLLYPI